MNAHKASLINGFILVLIGAWGAFESNYSPTSFIPVVAGVIILILNNGVKAENKVIAHIVVVLTFLLIFAFAMPFMAAMKDGRTLAMVRVGIMILSCIFAMIYFIKSFKAARIARENS